ncbi:MAG: hypothetical protein N2319_07350 [Candidatus Kapabacteria bacterium]|nr:hypothetical protein [Candidatus Kapabacteria bacterium]
MNNDDILIKDLSVGELKKIISTTIEQSLLEYYEDLIALNSKSFVESVKEAREEKEFIKLQKI